MDDVVVTKNTGEVAEFGDGGVVNRQRLNCCTATDVNYRKMLDQQTFKYVFEIGVTKTEVNQRLLTAESSDGIPAGRIIPDTRIAARPAIQYPAAMTPDKLRAEANRLIEKAEELEKE
jgi:hypothetical protein